MVRSYGPHVPEDDRDPDTAIGAAATADHAVAHYEIRVGGLLAPRWSAWFDGMAIEIDAADGTTAISGPVVDQAALYGLLQKLRDVGMTLVSLNHVSPNTNEPTAHPNQKEH